MQFKLPELGEGVHEGEMVKWRVKPGDAVKFDQPLCEIMTDKATVEIPSAFQGKVGELHAKEGEVVHVGQLLLSFEGSATTGASNIVANGNTQASHAPAPAQAAAPAASPAKSAPASSSHAAPAAMSAASSVGDLNPATRVLAAPATRRAAREMGVELATVSGSGPNGRVMREDLEQALKGGTGAVSAGKARVGGAWESRAGGEGDRTAKEERIAFRGLRKKIAEKMRQSKDHAAHFTYVEEADMSALVALRSQAKDIGAKQGVKVTYLPFIMKAMVAALKQYPILNSMLDESKQEIVLKHYYNIGLSVQTDDGLMAPVIKDVGNKSILEIARDIQEIVERARNKKLTMDDLTGSTITLTNAGTIGGLFATPVINFPEVAILGFNKIFRKPVVKMVDGKETIAIADWTYFSLSLDHRVVDGAIGAEFTKLFIQYIENPALLIMS